MAVQLFLKALDISIQELLNELSIMAYLGFVEPKLPFIVHFKHLQ